MVTKAHAKQGAWEAILLPKCKLKRRGTCNMELHEIETLYKVSQRTLDMSMKKLGVHWVGDDERTKRGS